MAGFYDLDPKLWADSKNPSNGALKGRNLEFLMGTKECQTVCETIKMLVKLVSIPALAFPDFKKHVKRYTHER